MPLQKAHAEQPPPEPAHQPGRSPSRTPSPVEADDAPMPTDPSYAGPVSRTYTVYKALTPVNYRVHRGTDTSQPAIFYVNNSTFTPGTPDVQLRAGAEKDGPIVAFAKFSRLSGDIVLGHGDPDKEGEASFEALNKDSTLRHKEYSFETADADPARLRRKRYVWKRHLQSNLRHRYDLLDGETGEKLAFFMNSSFAHIRNVGQMTVAVDGLPERFYNTLLVSWLAIREKEVRAKRRRAGGSGGGGGGGG